MSLKGSAAQAAGGAHRLDRTVSLNLAADRTDDPAGHALSAKGRRHNS